MVFEKIVKLNIQVGLQCAQNKRFFTTMLIFKAHTICIIALIKSENSAQCFFCKRCWSGYYSSFIYRIQFWVRESEI